MQYNIIETFLSLSSNLKQSPSSLYIKQSSVIRIFCLETSTRPYSMDSSNPKVITCKAAVVWKEGEMIKIEEIQVDPPKSNEVRIKMLFASLCHTDILASNGYPIVCYSVSISFFSSFLTNLDPSFCLCCFSSVLSSLYFLEFLDMKELGRKIFFLCFILCKITCTGSRADPQGSTACNLTLHFRDCLHDFDL
ncbi:hypothetical protein MTR67_011696 [Solanum verrucosum]|uniref:Alcohol dehydrogenase n=1 Tax=Solanum verrucosum TaxID=315347 RepID=A0AAF0QD43_SOLVR|nr:hypothetical protein MTR67_011696 [Solanum verrucosum]